MPNYPAMAFGPDFSTSSGISRIEAITVCVGYADFLEQIIPHNLPHFDRWIVVTSANDENTRKVCRKYSIDCLTSEEHLRGNSDFCKGRMIEIGLRMLSDDSWILHLDSDIVLPCDFKQVLQEADLNETCIYGCDRLNIVGWDNWQKVKNSGLWCRKNPWMLEMERPYTTVGARVANYKHGYTPIGYFQLWHCHDSHWNGFPSKRYPHNHGSAARTDVQHSLQWDRCKRVLIPELLVWHLESEKSKMGANWKGRTTKPFGPAL